MYWLFLAHNAFQLFINSFHIFLTFISCVMSRSRFSRSIRMVTRIVMMIIPKTRHHHKKSKFIILSINFWFKLNRISELLVVVVANRTVAGFFVVFLAYSHTVKNVIVLTMYWLSLAHSAFQLFINSFNFCPIATFICHRWRSEHISDRQILYRRLSICR